MTAHTEADPAPVHDPRDCHRGIHPEDGQALCLAHMQDWPCTTSRAAEQIAVMCAETDRLESPE